MLGKAMETSSRSIPTFFCVQRINSQDWSVAFTDRTSFRSVASRADLDTLYTEFPVVALLGVFDWSNYSHDVFREMSADEIWFSEHAIGVGITCLSCPSQLKAISSEIYLPYMTANTEPILFCFVNRILRGTVSGPRSMTDIKRWILQVSGKR